MNIKLNFKSSLILAIILWTILLLEALKLSDSALLVGILALINGLGFLVVTKLSRMYRS